MGRSKFEQGGKTKVTERNINLATETPTFED